MTKKRKGIAAKIIGTTVRFGFYSARYTLKWLFVDSFLLIRNSYNHARYPEVKNKLDRELELKKKVDLYEKKIKRLERLTYAIHKDPSYVGSDKGKDDIVELQRGLKNELH